MKTIPLSSRRYRAFTLIELLVVIAIIAILAALLLPALEAAKTEAMKREAQVQMSGIVTAIQKYNSDYSHFPVSSGVQSAAGGDEFTYGGPVLAPYTPSPIPASFTTNNSEVIAILMDMTNYPDGSGPTANANYQKNPRQNVYLNATMVTATNLPGVGPDLVYRDPWGNPYIITMDLDEDNQTKDAFYSLSAVSGPNGGNSNPGLNGLIDADGSLNNFQYHGNVMVWSAGPDGKIDPTQPANQGVNKDNILSWQ